MSLSLAHYLVLGAILFAIGVVGIFMNRRNVIIILMAIELMLLAVNMNFVAFSHYLGDMAGQVFVFFILTVAAAEAGRAKAQPHPEAQQQGHAHQDAGEAMQLVRHQQQAFALGMAVGRHHGQVHEDARQVEQAGEPGGDEDDVKGFDPEHGSIMGRPPVPGPSARVGAF